MEDKAGCSDLACLIIESRLANSSCVESCGIVSGGRSEGGEGPEVSEVRFGGEVINSGSVEHRELEFFDGNPSSTTNG